VRQHYSPEEFQWVLKIGGWARKRMEAVSDFGTEMLPPWWRRRGVV
jgi:hypothetical protein